MDDPTNDAAIEDVTRASTLPVKPMIACPSDIRAAIRVYYLGEQAGVAPVAPGAQSPPTIAVVPPPAPSSAGQVGAKPPPPPPDRARVRVPPRDVAKPPPPPPSDLEEPPPSSEAQSEAPQITQTDEKEVVVPRRGRPRMISLTLLDGTTINIPGPPKKKQRSRPHLDQPDEPDDAPESATPMSDQLTARDLVSAMRAVAHGADASDILGTQPRWEAMFSALLSILLRKGLIADWEFVEEFRKI
jgi:type IV pilus assembly protein PilB